METLELKHIMPYIHYDLTIRTKDKEGLLTRKIITRVNTNGIITCVFLKGDFQYDLRLEDIKPILNPLSGLHNENNGHFNEIKRKYGCINLSLDKEHPNMFVLNNEDVVSYHYLPYMVIRYLLKNHYDIFGLIEKGLAISYNDL